LGLQNQPYLAAKRWQAQISFQYADTNDFFVGDQRVENPQPNGPTALYGIPPRRRVAIYALDTIYGVTDRLSLDLTLPFVSGYSAVEQGTSPTNHQLYEYRAGGLGDVVFQAEYWLIDPRKASRFRGSVDVGFRAPTGNDDITGTSPTGEVPLDENTQLGSGGWGMLFRAQGSVELGGPFALYGSGYYGMSLTEHTNVAQGGKLPDGTVVLRGDPDTYSGRLGGAYLLPWVDGLVFTAGGRINGVAVRDIVGGGDLYFRRPGYEIYFEPGLSWTYGATIASLSVPLRVYQRKLDSYVDQAQGAHRGSDFAAFLVVASVARRF